MTRQDVTDEIALSEIATLLGCCRLTAYIRVRSGEIPGSRLVAGKLWVAPRSEVIRYKEQMKGAAHRQPLAAA